METKNLKTFIHYEKWLPIILLQIQQCLGSLWLSRVRLHPVLTSHESKEAWLQTRVAGDDGHFHSELNCTHLNSLKSITGNVRELH